MTGYVIPRLPVSAGALLWDGEGRLLVLHPTYKSGWTLPGGQVEADGETPWEGCRREVAEETGLDVVAGRLVCVDFLRPRPPRDDGWERPGGLRLLFDCGVVPSEAAASVVLQADELDDHRWADPGEVDGLLSGPLRRRVRRTLGAGLSGPGTAGPGTLYLEDGRPVAGVGWAGSMPSAARKRSGASDMG